MKKTKKERITLFLKLLTTMYLPNISSLQSWYEEGSEFPLFKSTPPPPPLVYVPLVIQGSNLPSAPFQPLNISHDPLKQS